MKAPLIAGQPTATEHGRSEELKHNVRRFLYADDGKSLSLVAMIITDDHAVSLFFLRSRFSMASCTVILLRDRSAQILS